MPERPPRRPMGGLAEPETVSGEYRQQLFDAKHELSEARRRIAELEAEAAQVETRKQEARDDFYRGVEKRIEDVIEAKLPAAIESALSRRPATASNVFNITTPAPFQPVPLPVAPPPPQAVALAPPMALPPGLPQMRASAPSSVTDQDIADAAAKAKADFRLKLLAIVFVPTVGLLGLMVSAIGSHYAATPSYAPAPYIAPAQPPVPGVTPTLPVLHNPPAPLPAAAH